MALEANSIVQCTDVDVLYEQGGTGNFHGGTLYFRELIRALKPLYSAIPRNAKRRDEIMTFIISKIQARGGRFLYRNSRIATWTVLDYTIIANKVAGSLRGMKGTSRDATTIVSSFEDYYCRPGAVPSPHEDQRDSMVTEMAFDRGLDELSIAVSDTWRFSEDFSVQQSVQTISSIQRTKKEDESFAQQAKPVPPAWIELVVDGGGDGFSVASSEASDVSEHFLKYELCQTAFALHETETEHEASAQQANPMPPEAATPSLKILNDDLGQHSNDEESGNGYRLSREEFYLDHAMVEGRHGDTPRADGSAPTRIMTDIANKNIQPNELDILYGQGGAGNNHNGTMSFRNTIRALKPLYDTIPRNGQKRDAIISFIISLVKQRGGRFLHRHIKAHPWTELDLIAIRTKVMASLRSMKVPKDGNPEAAASAVLLIEGQQSNSMFSSMKGRGKSVI